MRIKPAANYGANLPTAKPVSAADVIEYKNDDPLAIRAKILHLQETMREQPQVDCPVKHTFAPGVYAREILLPKGSVVVGKIHKHAHLNIISKGRASVMTEFGPMEIEAPHTFVSQPGTKRAVVALEDVVWTTIHLTDETDLDKIEDQIIAKDYEELGLLDAPAQTLMLKEQL